MSIERRARRALARIVRSSGFVGNGKIPNTALVAVMLTLRTVYMRRFFRRRSQLSGQQDSPGFVLHAQVFCNFGMVGADIPDHTV